MSLETLRPAQLVYVVNFDNDCHDNSTIYIVLNIGISVIWQLHSCLSFSEKRTGRMSFSLW